MEYPLAPVAGTWADLIPGATSPDEEIVITLLAEGVLEAWQDDHGTVRLYDARTHEPWTN